MLNKAHEAAPPAAMFAALGGSLTTAIMSEQSTRLRAVLAGCITATVIAAAVGFLIGYW